MWTGRGPSNLINYHNLRQSKSKTAQTSITTWHSPNLRQQEFLPATMATTTNSDKSAPHLALFPCAGMGHLIPFLRLAAMLASRGCTITFIAVQPSVSAAESNQLCSFLSMYPHIKRLDFQLLPYKKSKFTNEDPFFIQVESIGNSVHLLYPVLSSLSPPLSAVIADFPVTSRVSQLASDLSISAYTVITTSARFFSLMTYLPHLEQDKNTKCNSRGGNGTIELPVLGQMHVSSIPPPMLDPNHFFAANISSNVKSLYKVKGILINTFNWFESEAIKALSTGAAPILPVGPFESFETGQAHNLAWLDKQALVLLPSGLGNLTPFFQLAVMVASCNCKVTFINIQPQAPAPEYISFSSFFANHPRIEVLDFEMHPHNTSDSTTSDHFIMHFANINRSLYKLNPILSSSSVSAIFSDFVIAATLAQISADLNIALYIVSTTSAQFFSVVAYLPVLMAEAPGIFNNSSGGIEIEGLAPIPKSNIPPAWMHDSTTNNLLTAYLLPNARSLSNVKGVLLNTFVWFEAETITALNSSRVLNSLPPVFPIGPLQSYEPHKSHDLPWLNEQPADSVVYVNFGSREVMSTDQIRELEKGLEICGYNYLWVIEGNKEEGQDSGEFQEFSGDPCLGGTKLRGKIIRGWVDQERVLAHTAVGGFVNQCEWGSVMQAARHGVPMLAWPQHGDQKMNAEIVEKTGLGIWIKDWGWGGEKLVEEKEIGQLLKQIMGDLNIKKKAKIVRERAREACEIGGSSEEVFAKIIGMLTSNQR